jgi:hypothetical protein
MNRHEGAQCAGGDGSVAEIHRELTDMRYLENRHGEGAVPTLCFSSRGAGRIYSGKAPRVNGTGRLQYRIAQSTTGAAAALTTQVHPQ